MISSRNNQSGYSLVELIFYISIFALLAIALINALIVMTNSFRAVSVQAELIQSSNILEKVSREVRSAKSISTLSASDLTINTKDEFGGDKTIRFMLSGTDIQLLENGSFVGNLNSPSIVVTSLDFSQVTTSKGEGVKVSITLHSTNDRDIKSISFYNTIILRGSYDS